MTGLYTKFVANAVFPLHEWIKGHDTVQVRRSLEATQWHTPAQLREVQLERLQALLDHAYHYVPYYKGIFDRAGLQGGNITSLDDLTRLPLLTKPLIRANLDSLKSTRARGLSRFNTGGSSGEPLIFYTGAERVSHDVAAKWRATRWWDVDIGDREIVVWGSPIELGSQDRLRGLRDTLLRTRLLPAFEMSPEKIAGFVDVIRRTRPRMLFGYPSSLALLARYARAQGLALDGLGIRVIFVTSERLYEDQRVLLESMFGCKVANGYGGRDAGFIAHECPQGSMHITAEDIVVEILGPDDRPLPAGQAGEVVVTHLATSDFPFVRYKTGDVAIRDDKGCACGRGLPLLKEIQGRTSDFVTASDGTVMHGLALIYVLRDIAGIEAFKIIQEDLTYTRVILSAGNRLGADIITTIEGAFKTRLGQDVRVAVEQVPEIPPERSGKYRYVVSKIPV